MAQWGKEAWSVVTVQKSRSWIFEMLVIFCDIFSHSKEIFTFAPTFIILNSFS